MKETSYYLEREKILKSKTPDEFISKLMKSKMPQPHRSWTTAMWKSITGYTQADVDRARKSNPLYREKLREQNKIKNQKRLQEHDYSQKGKKVTWDDEKLSKFYDLRKAGVKDSELARTFKTTIPAIYSIRRKFNYSEKIAEITKEKMTKTKIVNLAKATEKLLRERVKELTSKKIPSK